MVTLRSINPRFRTSYGNSSAGALDLSGDGAACLFHSSKPLNSKLRGLPAGPFLVPAVLDALSLSEYKSVTRVVAGEADSFCAEAARNGEFVILTADSDLLVYDLGPYSAVVFFNQLELKPHQPEIEAASRNCGIIEAWLYKPGDIALRLGQSNLLRLAFEIMEDPSIPLSEALQRSKVPSDKQGKLENFEQGYTENSAVEVSLANVAIGAMDPRISELTLQLASKSEDSIHVYLPYLIDDPSRASAWAVGLSNRILAYSCINHAHPESDRANKVLEFGRKGSRIKPEDINLLSGHACILQAENFIAQLDAVRKLLSLGPSESVWRLLSILNVYRWYIENGKNPPSTKAFSRLTETATNETLRWEEIHLFAQLEAYLYSLRTLKQILGYARISAKAKMPAPLLGLETQLRGLPTIDKLLLSRRELSSQELPEIASESLVDTLLSSVNIEAAEHIDVQQTETIATLWEDITYDTAKLPETDQAKRKERGYGRKKHRKNHPRTSSRYPPAPNNRYSILAKP